MRLTQANGQTIVKADTRADKLKMGRRVYNDDAVALCRKLYIKFGSNADAIEKEMQKAGYANWRKTYLYDKPDRLGWIANFGFEKSLELHATTQINAVQNDDERRYKAIVQLADKYQERALNGEDEAIATFLKLTGLQVELRNKLDLSQSNFETFVEAFERITIWAKEVDTNLAKLFYKNKDAFIEKAALHYGKTI